MPETLQSNFMDLIYWTFLHNSEAIALFASSLIALGLLLWRPQRVFVLWLVGFSLLLARFEYLKHVVDPLTNQTMGVMIRTEGHHRASKWIDTFFYDLVPLALYVGGWGSIWLGMWVSHGKKLLAKASGERAGH